MAGAGATLLGVNPRKESDVWFSAGEMPVPKKRVRGFLIKALKGFAEGPHGTEALVQQRVAELVSGIAKDGAVVHARLSKVVVDSIKQTLKP